MKTSVVEVRHLLLSPKKGRNDQVRIDELQESDEENCGMPYAMLQTSEDIISGILNWVCPECGGPMGGPTKEFKCQGQCRKDWRAVWESRLAKPGQEHEFAPGSGQAVRGLCAKWGGAGCGAQVCQRNQFSS
jgi:hypothetical protein